MRLAWSPGHVNYTTQTVICILRGTWDCDCLRKNPLSKWREQFWYVGWKFIKSKLQLCLPKNVVSKGEEWLATSLTSTDHRSQRDWAATSTEVETFNFQLWAFTNLHPRHVPEWILSLVKKKMCSKKSKLRYCSCQWVAFATTGQLVFAYHQNWVGHPDLHYPTVLQVLRWSCRGPLSASFLPFKSINRALPLNTALKL